MRYYLQFIIPIIVIIAAIIEAKCDSDKRGKQEIEHGLSSLVRFTSILTASTMLLWYSNPFWYYTLSYTGINLGIFWIVFDYSYNKFSGLVWHYIGSTATLDRLARKYIGRGNTYLGVKVILTFICFIAYVAFD